jgi:hypothetical protein
VLPTEVDALADQESFEKFLGTLLNVKDCWQQQRVISTRKAPSGCAVFVRFRQPRSDLRIHRG